MGLLITLQDRLGGEQRQRVGQAVRPLPGSPGTQFSAVVRFHFGHFLTRSNIFLLNFIA